MTNKPQILKLLQEKKSLHLVDIEHIPNGFKSVNELEVDKYVEVTRDMQGLPITVSLTLQGTVFIQNGGYEKRITTFIKSIGKFISSLALKFIGLGAILLAIHIIQSLLLVVTLLSYIIGYCPKVFSEEKNINTCDE